MDEGHAVTTAPLLPHWSRAVVAPSPVDEDQTESGLIIPHTHGDGRQDFERGVVVALEPDTTSALEVGMVVYYRRGWKIRDHVVVDLPDILAYEPM
jgi:co-chaperonin GroES (HSP10)